MQISIEPVYQIQLFIREYFDMKKTIFSLYLIYTHRAWHTRHFQQVFHSVFFFCTFSFIQMYSKRNDFSFQGPPTRVKCYGTRLLPNVELSEGNSVFFRVLLCDGYFHVTYIFSGRIIKSYSPLNFAARVFIKGFYRVLIFRQLKVFHNKISRITEI